MTASETTTENKNPSANLTVEQRQLLLDLRAFTYRLYLEVLPLYNLLGADAEAAMKTRDLLGRLNYQLGVFVPPNTERYEYVVVCDNYMLTGTIQNCVSGLDMSANDFRAYLQGLQRDLSKAHPNGR